MTDTDKLAEIREWYEKTPSRLGLIGVLRDDVGFLLTHIEQLQAENERGEDKLHQINQWANAYPERIFTEPSKARLKEISAVLAEQFGRGTMDSLHGSWGRHILSGVREIIDGEQKP